MQIMGVCFWGVWLTCPMSKTHANNLMCFTYIMYYMCYKMTRPYTEGIWCWRNAETNDLQRSLLCFLPAMDPFWPRCAVISSIPSSGTSSFHCRGMVGRFVNVYLSGTDPNGVLTLCELEVYGELATLAPTINAVVMGRNIVVVQRKLCWSDALFYCRDFYWDLLSIRSEEEWREMEEVLRIQSPHLTKHVWVGLRRYLMAGTWFWMSGDSMNFTYWEAQSVWQNTSPCGGMDTRNHFYWRDLPCHDHLYFVCLTDFKKYKDRVEFYSSTRP
ncbi:uncharacterized protein LOC121892174 isoform X3 [Thunnus maccoyii]|uniref:uncharacterized protein LOC121892174 isoform X3 n=2 Tax=Thunnus maccoyii TaxID=8240 RepID=UPI001C4B3059|nr:uncharacterized protein LOC121892174 isoform X3 [Thunnus maccoyii]